MAFTLTVARYRGLPPDRVTSLPVGDGGCTIGRSPDNDLPLDDPERVISGCHARLELRDGALWVTDQSTNGTFLNQSAERLPARQAVRLHAGDTLTLGAYELSVAQDAPVEHPAPRGVDPFADHFSDPFGEPFQGPSRAPQVSEPLDLPGLLPAEAAPDILALLGATPTGPSTPRTPAADHAFADALALDPFLSGPAAPAEMPLISPPPTPFEHVYVRPPEIAPAAPGAHAPGAPHAPEEYDLLADVLGVPAAVTDPFANLEDPFADPGGVAPLGLRDASKTAEPADAGVMDAAVIAFDDAHPSPGAPIPVEAEGMASRPQAAPTGDDAGAVSSADPTGPEDAEASAAPSPAMPAPAAPTRPPAPTTAAAPPTAETGAGLAAFLAGLGTGSPESIVDPDRLLQDAGRLLRELTQGLTATMQARAQFKSELRLGVTTIRAAENNPYKFSVGVDEALDRLLFRPGPGYLPAAEAARGAFEDIQAHEMAMIAGLRAALRALLARFEPTELERRLGESSGLDRLLPMNRKARYWDLFTETYEQVAVDAAEDFMQLFGDAFTRAYEDQVYRLAQARAQAPGASAAGHRGRPRAPR